MKKGEPWGSATSLPPGAPVAHSNAELRANVEPALQAGETPPVVGIAGGDIWAAVGASTNTQERLSSGATHGAQIDAISVQTDTGHYFCCAHVIARPPWWQGGWFGRWFGCWPSGRHNQIVAIMNSEWLGRWRVAPAAHPGDGRLNIVEATPKYNIAQRLLARRRLRTGDHLPHPGLRSRRLTQAQFDFAKPLSLWLDGTCVGRVRSLRIEVVPAAVKIVF